MINRLDYQMDGASEDGAQSRLREIEQGFGIKVRFAPDWMALPVDRILITKYVRHELSGMENRHVSQMIASYRSWHTAFAEVLGEDAQSKDVNRPH